MTFVQSHCWRAAATSLGAYGAALGVAAAAPAARRSPAGPQDVSEGRGEASGLESKETLLLASVLFCLFANASLALADAACLFSWFCLAKASWQLLPVLPACSPGSATSALAAPTESFNGLHLLPDQLTFQESPQGLLKKAASFNLRAWPFCTSACVSRQALTNSNVD